MISFYPGPSKIWDNLPHYMQDAFKEGILSVNHRSQEFMNISSETIRLLHEKLQIPAEYTILFTSSATECWEIVAQSILGKAGSQHFYNGAFGEKWHEYTQNITRNATANPFGPDEIPGLAQIKPAPGDLMLAFTHNETSNGTALPENYLKEVRATYPDNLIAIDATSSIGGVKLPFAAADIWYGSVQKCFGLPAGLGLLILSPAAIREAKKLNENGHYNSLLFMLEKIADAQTPYTPNVLGIYLLMRSMQDRPGIEATADMLQKRYESWLQFLEGYPELKLLIKNPEARSKTVLTIESTPERIEAIKKAAKAEGLYIGNGYGPWKKTSFRIANFPALTEDDINQLKAFLKNYKW